MSLGSATIVGTQIPEAMGNSSSQIQADLDAAQKQLAAVSKQRAELQSGAAAAATIAEQKEQLSATAACRRSSPSRPRRSPPR